MRLAKMPKYTNMQLSSRLIQLNQQGTDLVKTAERKFTHFISTLKKSAPIPIQAPIQAKLFTPIYGKTHLSNKAQQQETLDKNAFNGVKELYFSGGGGAGCAYPSAVKYASDFGLDLTKVEVVCGVSVGSIVALGIALNAKAPELQAILSSMPTASFQDWSFWNIAIKFKNTWGFCRGQSMPNYFKQLIKERTGLDDPTFKEFHDAGFKKELRIVTTNVSTGQPNVFSYHTTPDMKVAEIVALSCSIPIVFPPKRIMNKDGTFDVHTDGGILKNFPWGMGATKTVSCDQRLGFALDNLITTTALYPKKQGNSITTFIDYLYQLFIIMLIEKPLLLTEEERQRTVVIRVNYNPIDFTPSPSKLKYLEDASYAAVKKLAENIKCKYKSRQKRCLL